MDELTQRYSREDQIYYERVLDSLRYDQVREEWTIAEEQSLVPDDARSVRSKSTLTSNALNKLTRTGRAAAR